ncbi:FISUMP domain-containing protein [Elizabethkingia ursingii]|nr:FISUMP domain-containing protein [Elizabethkingia ursingii]
MLSLILLFSCRGVDKGLDYGSKGEAHVKFKVSGWGYEEDKNFQAGLKKSAKNEIQSKLVKFSKDVNILVEVKPDDGSQNNLQASSQNKLNIKSAPISWGLEAGRRYRIIVYDKATEKYVTYQDYTIGQEATAAPMKLDFGKEYIFVAYAFLFTQDFPGAPSTDDLSKAKESLTNLNNDSGPLYFRKDDIGPLSAATTIDIVFKTKIASMYFVLNSTIGDITSLSNVQISPNYVNSDFKMSNGDLIVTGAQNSLGVAFDTTSGKTLTSRNVYVNVGSPPVTSNGSLSIGSITINGVTKNNITVSNINIKPGFNYNVNMSFMPSGDIIVDPETVLIDGRLWKRHNNGADTSIDPDKTPFDVRATGNYYQWGNPNPLANGTTMFRQIAWNYPQTPMPNGSWVDGGKNNNDPCPTGFRIPTLDEILSLNTTMNILGPTQGVSAQDANTIYTSIAGKVLISKNNPNVKLTFPMAGGIYVDVNPDRRNGQRYTLANVNHNYWVSTVPGDANSANVMSFNEGSTGIGRATSIRTMGYAVRCIGEK